LDRELTCPAANDVVGPDARCVRPLSGAHDARYKAKEALRKGRLFCFVH
jgi:hypothetical protein